MTDDRAERFADAAMAAGGCPNCGEMGPCDCDPRTAAKRDVADAFRQIARKAVDEVLGPDGPGPFPPSFRPVGGSTHPVAAEVDAAVWGIFDPRDLTWVWPDPPLVEGALCAFGDEANAGVWPRAEAERIALLVDFPGKLEVKKPRLRGSMPVEHSEDAGR